MTFIICLTCFFAFFGFWAFWTFVIDAIHIALSVNPHDKAAIDHLNKYVNQMLKISSKQYKCSPLTLADASLALNEIIHYEDDRTYIKFASVTIQLDESQDIPFGTLVKL